MTRDYTAADKAAIEALHKAQGLDYELPDLDGSDIVGIKVIEEENGQLSCVMIVRKTTELFLIRKSGGNPWQVWLAIIALQDAVKRLLKLKGFTDAHLFLPPQMEMTFGKRLMRNLGWSKQLWPCFNRKVGS